MRILMLLLTLLIAGNVMAQKEDVKFNFGFNKEFKTSNSEKIIIDGKEDLGTIAATGAMESAPFIVGDANSLFCVYEVQGTRRRIDIKRSTDNGATWVFWASAWADNYNFNSPQAFISNNYFYLTVGFEYSTTDWDIIVYKAQIGAVPTNEEAAYINQEPIFETKPSIIVNGSTMYIACLNTTTNTISVYSGSINSGFTKTDIFSSFVYPSAGYFFRIDGTNGSGTDIFTFNSGSQVYAYSRSGSSWSNILTTTGVGTRSTPSVGSYGSNWIVGYQYGTTGIYYRINGSTTEHYLADGKFPTFDMTNSPTGYVAATYTRNNLIYKKTSGVAQLPTFGSEVALFSNQLTISTGDFISMWPSNSNAGVAFCNVDTPTDYDIYFASLGTSSGGDGNDVPTSATAISSIPHTGNYEINPEGDIDWYRVNLTANTQYTFANSSSTNFDSEFYLYGPGNSTGTTIGAQVAYDDDGAPNNQPLIVYTPTTAGYYYLRVADYANNPTATNVKESKTENTLATGPYALSITAQTSQPILSVTPDYRAVISGSGTTTFTVSNTGTGTMSYTSSVTTGSEWCTITSGGSGSNSGTINVSYTANTGTTARTAVITVTATGATGSPKTVTVIQASPPSQPILSVTPDNRDVTSASGTTTFSVSNTGTGTMSYTSSVTTGSAWCTITSGGTGSNTGTINVSYTANTGTTARTAQITVTATGATGSPKIVTVTQATPPTQPILSVTPDNRDVTSASGTTTFSVSNTGTGTMSYTSSVTTGSAWCTITSGGSGSNTGTINVSYTANTSTTARTAQITVTATGATGSPKIVTVTQAGHSGHGWVVTPNLQFNMSVIAQLYFTNVLTTNTADAIGAFVGTECRGIANPQGTNGLLFLTVGSNLSSGETITFKAWKSSTNEIQPIAQTIPFQNMGEIGTLTSPFRMDAGMRTQIISFGEGYTWFSVNVNPGNMSLNSLFVPPQLNPASNDRVISQTQFATWGGSSWIGSLTTINPLQRYVMKLSTAQVCTLQGQPVEITSIPLGSGYSWLGYPVQNSLPVNTALAGITPAPVANDRIISQTQFATWSGSSWIGSLTTMEPGKGYVIKLTNASTLVYPSTAAKIDSTEHKLLDSPNWVPLPNLQFNMSVIAKVQIDASLYSTNPNDLLGAFVGTECRGVATPIAPDGFYFLTVGSNLSSGETVTFKYYSSQYNLIKELGETVPFQNMGEIGTLSNPYILNAVPIPVEFISFGAKQIGKDIKIAWTTATETNNKEFEVERRLNGSSTWMKIGEVEGGGTTTSIREYSFIDKAIKESGLFNYRLKQIDFDGSYEYSNEIEIAVDLIPTEFSLSQNYPNPFNPSTRISYAIPATANVTLKVFDVVGNEVATLVNESKEPGNYEVTFEAGNLSNGVYFYELKANEFRVVKKLVLMK